MGARLRLRDIGSEREKCDSGIGKDSLLFFLIYDQKGIVFFTAVIACTHACTHAF